MGKTSRRPPAGIDVLHSRRCASRDGANCNCGPLAYRPWISRPGVSKTGKRIGVKHRGPRFRDLSAATGWRIDALRDLRHGEFVAPTSVTVNDAAAQLIDGMRSGEILAKGRKPFKPSTVATYDASLTLHVLKRLGPHKLTAVTTHDVQTLIDELNRTLSGQTVRNVVIALSAVYRLARRRGWANVNPTRDLELPAAGRRRERVVDPIEGRDLLSVLPIDLQAWYALALYAGLRRGELAALDWSDVRFDESTIVVRRAYCWRAKAYQAPKTDAAERVVPMATPLAAIILDHRIASGGTGLLFTSTGDSSRPPDPRSMARRAETAWRAAAQKRADAVAEAAGEESKPVTSWPRIVLHEGRHSAASAFIASNLDPVRVAEWMGHANVSTTTDIYAKAFKARERVDAQKLEAFHAECDAAAVPTANRPNDEEGDE